MFKFKTVRTIALFSTFLLTSTLSVTPVSPLLASANQIKTEWRLNESDLGLSFQYDYSSYRTSTPKSSVPTVNRVGDTYLIGHRPGDNQTNTLLCIDVKGKVKWKIVFKKDELDSSNYIKMDNEGNLFYITRTVKGKRNTGSVHSIDPNGKQRWNYSVSGKMPGNLNLIGDGNIAVQVGEKLHVLNAKGKLLYTKSLPQTEDNNLTFMTASHGKILYRQSNFKKGEFTGFNIKLYDSNNDYLFTIPAKLSFGVLYSHFVHFFDNGDFLQVQGYDTLKKTPAVLNMYRANGKLLWKKVLYRQFDEDNVFISKRNIYYYTGTYPNVADEQKLFYLDADTGKEQSSFDLNKDLSPTIYLGHRQEVVDGNESFIQSNNNDLSSPLDDFIYVLHSTYPAHTLKQLAPDLKTSTDYTADLDAFMLENYGKESHEYTIISARNGSAYVKFKEEGKRTYSLMKVKLFKSNPS